MTFRVWKGEAASTPRQAAPVARPPVLPPDLIDAGAKRLTVLALLAAGAVAAFALLEGRLARLAFSPAGATVWTVGVVAGVGLSLAVAWIAWREMLSPETLLDFALVYEVAEAFCFSLAFHSVHTSEIPRGWSPVAVWILAYPLIVPGTRGKTLIATVAAALMDPLGLLVNVVAGVPAPPWPGSALMFFPTAVSVAIALVVSRIVYELNVEAGRGHEMGSYRLEERLGRGGMGEVWKASHRLLARSAAIKLIRPDSSGASGRESLRRFEREARAAAALRSPHTVGIYDYGTTEDGTFYYVMELLEGFDLETLVREFGPLPPERAIHLLRQACHSLAEAHEGGLIHRDVKPANIYVCRYGLEWDFVKLLDFGLDKSSALSDSRERQLTAAGMIAGTPGYMSPEMGRGSPDVDWRSDIYSLGSVGYWLLTGETLFGEGTPIEVVVDHIQKPPIAPSRRAPVPVPEELDAAILSCLAKDPNNRPQTMQELSRLLGGVRVVQPWTEERARRWWLEFGMSPRKPRLDEDTERSTDVPRVAV
jgi:serine/threonine-protein kinase